MLHSLWKAALARPVMSSMIGLAVGTASSISVATVQPQPSRSFAPAPGSRLAQVGPEGGSGSVGVPGTQGGGGGFTVPMGNPPQGEGGSFPTMPGGPRGDMRGGQPGGGLLPQQPPGGSGEFGTAGQGQGSGQMPSEYRGPGGFVGGRGPENTPQGGLQVDPQRDQGGNTGERRMEDFDQARNQEEQERRMKEDESRQEAQQKQQEEQQKRQEEQQKRQEEQGLKMMKKGILQAARGVTQMKSYFSRIAKKGVVIPTECTEALNKIQTTIDTIKNATTFEEAQEAEPESMRDDFETLNECRQKVEMLAQIPSILKRVDREIKNMERSWLRAKKNTGIFMIIHW